MHCNSYPSSLGESLGNAGGGTTAANDNDNNDDSRSVHGVINSNTASNSCTEDKTVDITRGSSKFHIESLQGHGGHERSRYRYHNYEIEAGFMKEEAIELFQRFYTMENQRAPEEKRKRRREKGSTEDSEKGRDE